MSVVKFHYHQHPFLTVIPISVFSPKFNPNSISFDSSSGSYNSISFESNRRRIDSRKQKGMRGGGFEPSALGSADGEENIRVLEQEQPFVDDDSSQSRSILGSSSLESILNRLSKWLVAGLFGGVILLRHDAEALWAAMGSVLNSVLSVTLKNILNEERPTSNLRSDPGMPSSHAQSISFAAVFAVLSMVEWLGVNELTLILSGLIVASGSYLSWLRVSQRLHTVSQVAVGAIVGSSFAGLWFWTWDAAVVEAFNSSMSVRVSVFLSAAFCCMGFLVYVIRYWFTDDR